MDKINQSEEAELKLKVVGSDKIKMLTLAIIGEDNAWLPSFVVTGVTESSSILRRQQFSNI